MGFLSSIKRLLFAQKSLAKSAAEKTADYAMEKGSELTDKAKDVVEDAGGSIMDKTSGLRDAVMNKAEDLMEKGKDLAEDAIEKGKEFAAEASDMAETAIEKGKEFAEDATDMAETAIEKGKDFAGDISDKISNNEVVKKATNVSETVGDKVLTAGETVVGTAKSVSESVGEKVLDAGESVMEKAASISEDVGSVVLDKGADVMDRAKDLSEDLGHKVMDVADDVVARAKDFAGDMSEKLDETYEKAKQMEAEEALKPKKDFADDTLDAEGSLLDDTDDFFSKADKYAGGEYDAFSEGKITIKDNDGLELKASDKPSKPTLDYDSATDAAIDTGKKAAGFEDLDGDGNELIDDAIVADEEE